MSRAIVLLISFVLPSISWATCAPEKMIRIEFRDATPGLEPDSFTTRPKILYRLSTLYARMEEEPDPELIIHNLTIVNEPDFWMINLASKTGQHMVDQRESNHFRAPVLAVPDSPEFVLSFEFGCELAFMKARSIKPETTSIESRKLESYKVTEKGHTLFLAVDPDLKKPVFAALYKEQELAMLLGYLKYETQLEPDMSLFRPPPGITISEANP